MAVDRSVLDIMREVGLNYALWDARHAGEKLDAVALRFGIDKEEARKRIALVQREVSIRDRALKEFEERFPHGVCPYCGAEQ